MSSSRDRIEIWVKADLSQPELLTGLDTWLHLGLIEHNQVKRLAKYRLSCTIPEPVVTPTNNPAESKEPTALAEPSPTPATDNQVEHFSSATEPKVETWLSRAWNAFREELSIRWLLFLGVFAVLVASGGLAASQWENFSAVAQYGVLWGYTIAFAGVGTWIAKQPRSRLTAGALQTITALLVPINFWAMDALISWKTLVGWLMIGVATITLSGWGLWQTQQRLSFAVVFLGISYLHWGWQIATWPLIAIYLGAIATTAIMVFFSEREDRQNEFALSEVSLTIYALLILLGRGILVADVPLNTLDLAIAISGWLLTLNQPRQEDSLIFKGMALMGMALLVMAWGLALEKPFPWQAVVATILALELFWRRLRRSWWHWDLIAMFGIGLQGWGLLWQLIPVTVRSQVVLAFEQGLDLENASFWLLPTIGFFPYLILFLGIAEWLYYVEKPKLGQLGEGLSLGLGAILTLLALPDPSTRSLILLLDALALILVVARRSPTRIRLVYFTRIVSWLAIISSLDWGFNLGLRDWGTFFLLAMVGEWAVSTPIARERNPSAQQVAYRSGWYFGFLFAGLSLVLLLGSRAGTVWGLLWLITPITLTILRPYSELERKPTATVGAMTTSLLAQGLTLSSLTPRIISWSVATVLLAINARYFPNRLLAMLPVGSALAWAASPFWKQLEWPGWSLWGAIALVFLWSVTDILNRRSEQFSQLYASATYNWGIILCVSVLTIITGHGFSSLLQPLDIAWQYPLAAGLSTIALGSRYWQIPREVTGYGLIIAMALTASESVYWAGGSQLQLAVVNLVLGLLTLVVTSQLPREQLTTSLHIAPLCFTIIGIIARMGHFTAYTGLLTLLAAVMGLFVGSRRQQWKNISYVSLLGIFFAIHELVIYQFWQVQPAISDSYSLLATVTLILALLYQLSLGFLQRLQRDTILGLHLEELQITAHLHWGVGGILEGIATLLAGETLGTIALIGIANCVVLLSYALRQAYQMRHNRPVANLWLGAGWLGSELMITEIIQLTPGNWLAFATTHIILGFVALAVTELWRRQGNPFSRLASIELLPLVWVSVGLVTRYGHFTAETGGLVLASAIVALGVGSRRQNWTIISRIALFAFSFGCYELLIYAMLHRESNSLPADAFTLLASVAAGIAGVELGLFYWARSRFQETILGLPLQTLQTSAHLHWAGGSLLEIIAIALAMESDPKLTLLGIGISIILATYAVIQGRDYSVSSDWWVYVGLVQLIGIAVVTRLLWTELAVLDPWSAVIACFMGLILLTLPWYRWGWNPTPWYYVAIALPALRVIATTSDIEWFNLFIVAGFYGGLAWREQQVRWSYGSLVLVAWGMAQLLARFQLDAPLWYALIVGLPILYVANFDLVLRSSSKRAARHWLRLFGSSIIGFTALFYHPELGLAPLLIGLMFVFTGIALQVRAFLFVGTTLLILTGIQQLYTFSQLYPFAKWVIGLVMGIVLIAIAASFESQRERILSRFQDWRERLQQWD